MPNDDKSDLGRDVSLGRLRFAGDFDSNSPLHIDVTKTLNNTVIAIKGIKRPGVPRPLIEAVMAHALSDVFGADPWKDMDMYYLDNKKFAERYGMETGVGDDSVSIAYTRSDVVRVMSINYIRDNLARRVKYWYGQLT